MWRFKDSRNNGSITRTIAVSVSVCLSVCLSISDSLFLSRSLVQVSGAVFTT